jgi:hypothetical protein
MVCSGTSVDRRDGAEHAVVEQQPVARPLEGGLGDQAPKVEAVEGEGDARLLHDLALRALGGALAGVHVELAPDGAAQALVGRPLAVDEQDAALLVADVAEAGEFVGQGLGHGRRW